MKQSDVGLEHREAGVSSIETIPKSGMNTTCSLINNLWEIAG